jgi:hypothetical protein
MTHKIYPHGLLEPLAPNIWQVKGSLPFPLPRYMTVVRLDSGKLLIYSAMAMDEGGVKALEALGDPAFMVVPHPSHAMDAPFYKARYPHIKVIAAADAQARLSADVPVDGPPELLLPPLGVRHHIARGMKSQEIVLDVATAAGGRALFFTDLFAASTSGSSLMMRLLGTPGQCGVPRIVKFRQVSDKKAVRSFLRELAGLENIEILSGTHGPPVKSACREALEEAARRV